MEEQQSVYPDWEYRVVRHKLTDEEVRKILLEYSGKRNNRRHKPGRAFESSYYTFDILSDYGAFRDLQRHRLMTIEWQKMSPDLGFDMPEEVSEVGMKEDCAKLVATSEDLHDLLSRDMPDLREYALLLGHISQKSGCRKSRH
jgi:hypothetical protein